MLPTDPAALRALAGRLVSPIHREVALSVRRCGPTSRQDIADLVQGVLLYLLERDCQELRRWDPSRGRSLESFVRLIARRYVARSLKRSRTFCPVASAADDQADDLPDRRIQARQVLSSLVAAIAGRRRDEDLFRLVFVQELEPAAVARQMGMSRTAVNAWTYRRRQQARRLLAAA